MTKRFQRGLVVGKFAPLHRGHEHLIHHAFDVCDEVIILSYCKPEFPGCEAERREQWLAKLFPAARVLVATDARLVSSRADGAGFHEVPSNDADEITHRRFCGFLCQHVLGLRVEAVFTSEDYGEGFAAELTRYFRAQDAAVPEVRHVLVDRERKVVPVSGTLLRADAHAHREWLSPAVYASFVRRICLLGGESSGKSTLAEALAREHDTCHVSEYGRELWELKKGALVFDDMLQIAERQIAAEEEAAGRANRYLFCDTSPLTTLFYSNHLFGRAEPALELLAGRPYDLTVLCEADFPFVQDGTRQSESLRSIQHNWYLRELADRAIPFLLVTGSVADRVRTVGKGLKMERAKGFEPSTFTLAT